MTKIKRIGSFCSLRIIGCPKARTANFKLTSFTIQLTNTPEICSALNYSHILVYYINYNTYENYLLRSILSGSAFQELPPLQAV